jgi:hypothetical protein
MYTENILSDLRGSIAIVGSGNAPGNFGGRIDKYDNVIRTHNYKIDEYSEKIGTKTSLICHCTFDLEAWTKDIQKICPFQEMSKEARWMVECGGRDPTIFAQTNAQENTGLEWPTTGISLLFLFERLGIEADVFLMDGYKTGHYYDPVIPEVCFPHKPSAEQERLAVLTKLNFIGNNHAVSL